MRTNEIRKELDVLLKNFEACNIKHKSLEALKNDLKLMRIFADLLSLMQYKEFFEVLLADGFVTELYSEDVIDSASPLLPLLDLMCYLTKGANKQPNSLQNFSIQVNEPVNTFAEVDAVIPTLIQEMDESFMGCFALELDNLTQKYSHLLNQLRQRPNQHSALFYLTDGVDQVEFLFVIKENEQLNAYASSSFAHKKASSIYAETANFVEKIISCPNITLVEDDNAAVDAELIINSILYEAYKRNSMQQTLTAIKNNQLNVAEFKVQINDLSKTERRINEFTLARWLAFAGHFFTSIRAQGWLDFCKEKQIHPLHIVKTSYPNWPLELYQNRNQLGEPFAYFPEGLQFQQAQDPQQEELKLLCNQLNDFVLAQIERLEKTKGKGVRDKKNLYSSLKEQIDLFKDSRIFDTDKLQNLIYQVATISHHRRHRSRNRAVGFFSLGLKIMRAESWEEYHHFVRDNKNKFSAPIKEVLETSLNINKDSLSCEIEIAGRTVEVCGYDDYRGLIKYYGAKGAKAAF